MPWKERYTISDEKSIVDSDITWPDGKRCCFRVVVDLSPACGPDGIKPADLATPDAYYGMNGGLAALVSVLDRYDIKATFAVPAVIAEIQADTLRRLAGEGHEIAAHGFKHEDVSKLDKDDERTRLARTTEIIAKVAGQRPAGWFSLAAARRQVRRRRGQPEHDRPAGRGRLRVFRQRSCRRRAALLGERLRQPPRDPGPALLLSLR